MSSVAAADHYEVLIVGGGTAGLTVAARLGRAGVTDIAVLEPSASHYYQPLWTLVGGGRAPQRITVRPQARVIPSGVSWPARLRPTARTGRDAGPARRLQQLPVRPGPAHLAVHPRPAGRHRPVHDAAQAGQVRRRPAEDRLPGR